MNYKFSEWMTNRDITETAHAIMATGIPVEYFIEHSMNEGLWDRVKGFFGGQQQQQSPQYQTGPGSRQYADPTNSMLQKAQQNPAAYQKRVQDVGHIMSSWQKVTDGLNHLARVLGQPEFAGTFQKVLGNIKQMAQSMSLDPANMKAMRDKLIDPSINMRKPENSGMGDWSDRSGTQEKPRDIYGGQPTAKPGKQADWRDDTSGTQPFGYSPQDAMRHRTPNQMGRLDVNELPKGRVLSMNRQKAQTTRTGAGAAAK